MTQALTLIKIKRVIESAGISYLAIRPVDAKLKKDRYSSACFWGCTYGTIFSGISYEEKRAHIMQVIDGLKAQFPHQKFFYLNNSIIVKNLRGTKKGMAQLEFWKDID